MSNKKKNYRAMYNKPKTEPEILEVCSITRPEEVEVIETPLATPEIIGAVEVIETPLATTEVVGDVEVIEAIEDPKCEFTVGVVTGCSRLNVRNAPEIMAEVICTIPVWSEIQICLTHENDSWYHVITAAGQEGYCMKQFIEIK